MKPSAVPEEMPCSIFVIAHKLSMLWMLERIPWCGSTNKTLISESSLITSRIR
jgi:hypothetical protein